MALPVSVLLARTADIAVGLSGARVYTTGVEFTIDARRRGPGGERMALNMFGRRHAGGGGEPFLFGLELADGRMVTNVRGWPPDRRRDPDPESPSLQPGGGGGDGRFMRVTYFLRPIPPAGDLTAVVAWPSFGIEETRITLDATPMRDAAAHVLTLWPEQLEDDRPEPVPAPPPLPPGGWFDRAEKGRGSAT